VAWRVENPKEWSDQSMSFLWRSSLWSVQQFSGGCDPWNICDPLNSFSAWSAGDEGAAMEVARRALSDRKCTPKVRQIQDADYDDINFGAWDVCPKHLRSPSGCGDFMDDPRNAQCPKLKALPEGNNHQYVGEPIDRFAEGDKQHRCFNQFLDHQKINYVDLGVPPSTSTHREMWAKWGEYEFLPPHRWLHNLEHGGIAFLYHECLPAVELCKIKSYIAKLAARYLKEAGEPLRWMLTPYKNLQHPMGIVLYGHVYMSNHYNENDMDKFFDRFYRWAYEDIPRGGTYDHLLLTESIDTSLLQCPKTHYIHNEWNKSRYESVGPQLFVGLVLLAIPAITALRLMRKKSDDASDDAAKELA
jgi:hypothetical protein